MKYWLSHLPLEVWVDVFRYPWISLEGLGQIVDRFMNRRYAEYLQFYPHDWGKRKLAEHLWFDKDGLYKRVRYEPHRCNLDIPLTPVPYNIKSVECISIKNSLWQKLHAFSLQSFMTLPIRILPSSISTMALAKSCMACNSDMKIDTGMFNSLGTQQIAAKRWKNGSMASRQNVIVPARTKLTFTNQPLDHLMR